MRFLRLVSMVLLGFLASTAIVGAIPMLRNPDGEPWQMPQSLLEASPFHSFLIPGLILLVMNGLLSLLGLWFTWKRANGYGLWVAAQGCVLLGWLTVECQVLRMVLWPHYFYGTIALLLVATGLAQRPGAGRQKTLAMDGRQ